MPPQAILFTHFGDDWIRGSEVLLLDLLAALDKTKIEPVVWCNGSKLAAAARAEGYPTYRDDFQMMFDYGSPKADLGRYLRLIGKCRALCRRHKIEVLHSNSLAPAQWLVPAGIQERTPVVAHLHIDYLRRSRYALLLHAATMIVGVSRQVIEGPLEDGVAPERTRVIYNGIDFSRLTARPNDLREKLGIPAGAIVIATMGSLIPRKGHDVLIRALHALPAEPVSPHLVIPSSGSEEAALKKLVQELGLSDRVHFVGNIDHVTRVYRAADIFALASRGDAFGLVRAEAGHFGLPAVSTRVGGIPEVVLDGQTGLLVPPDDVAAFSTALARLIGDPALRAQMGAAARRRVDENFGVRRMAAQFEDLYAELAAEPHSQRGWSHALRGVARPYSKLMRLRPPPAKPRYSSVEQSCGDMTAG